MINFKSDKEFVPQKMDEFSYDDFMAMQTGDSKKSDILNITQNEKE